MKNLEAILKQINWTRKWHGAPIINVAKMNQSDADLVVNHIYIALEPENLHCDGEISRSQAMAKEKMLKGALREISTRGFSINPPEWC